VLCVVEEGAEIYCFYTLVLVPQLQERNRDYKYTLPADRGLVDRVVMIFLLSSIHVCRWIPMEIFPSALLLPVSPLDRFH